MGTLGVGAGAGLRGGVAVVPGSSGISNLAGLALVLGVNPPGGPSSTELTEERPGPYANGVGARLRGGGDPGGDSGGSSGVLSLGSPDKVTDSGGDFFREALLILPVSGSRCFQTHRVCAYLLMINPHRNVGLVVNDLL